MAMRDRLTAFMAWALSAVSLASFGFVVWLAFHNNTAGAGVVLIGALSAAAFANFDRLESLKAGLSGLEFKIAEATNVLEGLRRLAVVTANSLIRIQLNQGVLGGAKATDRDSLRDQLLDTLKAMGVSKTDVDQVSKEYRDRDLKDHLVALINHIHNNFGFPVGGGGEWYSDFVRGINGNFPPTPQKLEELMAEHGRATDFSRKLVGEYCYYFESGKHKDATFWRDRDNWPVGPKSE